MGVPGVIVDRTYALIMLSEPKDQDYRHNDE